MGNLSLKNMCGNDNPDERSEIDTINRDLKVKNKPNIMITDHGTEIRSDGNPKSRIAKYFLYFKKKHVLQFYINKWRFENLNFYLKGYVC